MHPLKRVGSILFILVLILGVFAVGFFVGRTQLLDDTDGVVVASGFNSPSDVDLTMFWDVWTELDKNFVGSNGEGLPSNEERIFGAIKGLTDSFGDPYTVFLPPQESSLFEDDLAGNFGGVGMEIGVRDEILTVIAPLQGTPAEKAGIRAGDSIVAIDGVSTFSMSIDEAVLKIRGEVDTSVLLTLLREGEDDIFDIEVIRGVITVPTLHSELRPDGIYVIRLFNFSFASPDEFRSALRRLVQSGSNKLILDLRGNPGGFLQASIDIASRFLAPGKIVVSEKSGEETQVHRSKGYDIFDDDFHMVTLIDGGSASASEIVAGALRDHGKTTLVGTQTFGKGSVQELVEIGFTSSLRLTVAHWLTPSGESISENGISPDVVVEFTTEDFEEGRDPQMDEAVRILLSK